LGYGGDGIASSITGSSVTYGGGGGGGSDSPVGIGGDGGGGNSGAYLGLNSTAGTVNTGGGGGGGASQGTQLNGSAGGSGIVVIRYADTFPNAASTTGSPTLYTTGGYKYYKFTGSGSITF
jgi:hypothetical protein